MWAQREKQYASANILHYRGNSQGSKGEHNDKSISILTGDEQQN